MPKRKATLGVALTALLTGAVLLPGCSRHANPWKELPGGSTRVLVSFPPLYCFTKAVADDKAKVLSLLTTVGPHDHKPTADDALVAREADLFLVNGLSLDDFVTRVANNSGNRSKDLIQKIAEAIPADKLIKTADEHSPHGEKGGHEGHDHGEFDPHVWLGPDMAVLMVNRIRDLLVAQSPTHKKDYEANAAAYTRKLQQLQTDGLEALKGVKNRKFITNHHSFRYFARAFNLEVLDSIQMQPGVPVEGLQLAKLVELCKKHQVRVIGVEPQYPKAGAETLQRSVGKEVPDLTIVELDPIETAPPDRLTPDYYLERIKANIDNLAKHLK